MTDLLVNLADAIVKDNVSELTGKTVTRPILFAGDEAENRVYVVDVDIGEGEVMKDVAIATGNNETRYTQVGQPVTMQKIGNRWTIVGFSKTMPGTFFRVPVAVPDFEFGLPTYTTGTVENLSFTVRTLTYQELGEYGEYGVIPYGALGRFQGITLVEIFV